MRKIIFCLIPLVAGMGWACREDFLRQPPHGTLDQTILQNDKGVYAALIGAYSALDGWSSGSPVPAWFASGSNWIWGSVASDDSYTGSQPENDESVPIINEIEKYSVRSTNPALREKWVQLYNGVARSNTVLNLIAQSSQLPNPNKTHYTAEARFLRGHYHFEAKKIFGNVPYVDEKAQAIAFKVPNQDGAGYVNSWPQIEADLQAAADSLPESMPAVGRVNQWAAKAMLAKVYLFQQKFDQALPILNEVIANGRTSNGKKYALNECFHDNFNAETKNSAESVFAVQYSVNDGSGGLNAGIGDVLNYNFNDGPGLCCGFNQPSQNLVNAFKTDENGLPLPETFNEEDVTNDQGIESGQSFLPYTLPLDPRLDWTVGRRGIPYLDWGVHPGKDWIRDQRNGGPYSPLKNLYHKSQQGTLSDTQGWAAGPNANNYTLIRFADVLLWAAECEAEVGSLARAREYVNLIRQRAKNSCWVMAVDANNQPTPTPAANYVIAMYEQPWPDQDYARRAIRFERRLELAMEGHRFFDLVRWGIAAKTLNDYLRVESTKRQYLRGAYFKEGQHEYFPIPYEEIINSSVNGVPTLSQNPGYE